MSKLLRLEYVDKELPCLWSLISMNWQVYNEIGVIVIAFEAIISECVLEWSTKRRGHVEVRSTRGNVCYTWRYTWKNSREKYNRSPHCLTDLAWHWTLAKIMWLRNELVFDGQVDDLHVEVIYLLRYLVISLGRMLTRCTPRYRLYPNVGCNQHFSAMLKVLIFYTQWKGAYFDKSVTRIHQG